jgi:hypothetical protein
MVYGEGLPAAYRPGGASASGAPGAGTEYGDFGPTLAAEYLAVEHQLTMSRENPPIAHLLGRTQPSAVEQFDQPGVTSWTSDARFP